MESQPGTWHPGLMCGSVRRGLRPPLPPAPLMASLGLSPAQIQRPGTPPPPLPSQGRTCPLQPSGNNPHPLALPPVTSWAWARGAAGPGCWTEDPELPFRRGPPLWGQNSSAHGAPRVPARDRLREPTSGPGGSALSRSHLLRETSPGQQPVPSTPPPWGVRVSVRQVVPAGGSGPRAEQPGSIGGSRRDGGSGWGRVAAGPSHRTAPRTLPRAPTNRVGGKPSQRRAYRGRAAGLWGPGRQACQSCKEGRTDLLAPEAGRHALPRPLSWGTSVLQLHWVS